MAKLYWKTEQRFVKDLMIAEINPRKISQEQKEALTRSLEKFNLADIPVLNTDNTIISGNQRLQILYELGKGDEKIDVRVPNRKLNEEELKEYMLIANTHAGVFDVELLDAHFEDVNIDFDIQLIDEKGKITVKEHQRSISPEEFGTDFSLASGDKSPFQQITFTLADVQAEEIKEIVAEMKKSEGFKETDFFGNENQNGNAIYKICKEWVELKK
jgi:hypothetical protein